MRALDPTFNISCYFALNSNNLCVVGALYGMAAYAVRNTTTGGFTISSYNKLTYTRDEYSEGYRPRIGRTCEIWICRSSRSWSATSWNAPGGSDVKILRLGVSGGLPLTG